MRLEYVFITLFEIYPTFKQLFKIISIITFKKSKHNEKYRQAFAAVITSRRRSESHESKHGGEGGRMGLNWDQRCREPHH